MRSISETLDSRLQDVVLYYYAVEDLDKGHLNSLALSLDDDVQADLTRKDLDLQELSNRLSTVLDLYQEAAEVSNYLRQQFDLTRYYRCIQALTIVSKDSYRHSPR